jgi:hypothetical protein
MATGSSALERPRNPALATAAVAGVLAYAWVGGGFRRFTMPATGAVVLPGAVVLYLAAWRPPPRVPPPRRIDPAGARAWAALALALCLWELWAFLHQPTPTVGSYDHPTLSVLSDLLLASHPARSLALLAWLGCGRSLLRR